MSRNTENDLTPYDSKKVNFQHCIWHFLLRLDFLEKNGGRSREILLYQYLFLDEGVARYLPLHEHLSASFTPSHDCKPTRAVRLGVLNAVPLRYFTGFRLVLA